MKTIYGDLMKAQKFVMAPNNGRELEPPTEYPESETVQSDALSISEMFERYNQNPEAMNDNFFDASESDFLHGFLKPNQDLTDLDALRQKNERMQKTLDDAIKRRNKEEKEKVQKQAWQAQQRELEDEIAEREAENQED